jgi:hydroxyethylthiazole kinase-like uncharacterized protein yjeF
MKYVSVDEMIKIEKEADASGLTYEKMMENAGKGLAEVIIETYGDIEHKKILALVGSGNNGGDSLVALAHLAEMNWSCAAYIVKIRSPNDPLVARLTKAGGEIYSVKEDSQYSQLKDLLAEYSVVLDGVLGTGIKLPLRGKIANVLANAKRILASLESPPYIVAVDCPSGVDSDTGAAADECIPADLTVTMAAVKRGLLALPAYEFLGDLTVVDIGLDEDIKSWDSIPRIVPDAGWVLQKLPQRKLNSHKGTFGTALIVAGSVNFTGAVLLSGESAYRAGAGLVTLAVPSVLHSAVAGQLAEATWVLLPHEMGVIASHAVEVLKENLGRATAMLIGPGFGMEDTTRDFLSRLLIGEKKRGKGGIGFVHASEEEAVKESQGLPPLVIDADGLKLTSQLQDWYAHLPPESILTPHPGEMSVLTGLPVQDIQEDRIGTAERFARQWGHVVVLKGAFTVVASPDGSTAVIPVATPALARAGTGDVLAGLIVGLRAQGLDAFSSAVTGAWIHAQAGLRAAELIGSRASVIAGDVILGAMETMAELEMAKV